MSQSIFRRLFGKRQLGQRAQESNRYHRSSRLSMEALEDRRLLTTTLYIDFGNNFPMNGLQMTALELRDSINGPDINSQVFTGGTAIPLNETIVMTQDVPLGVQADILPIVQRAFEPYAIDVVVSAVNSVADVQALYNANAGDPTGEFDVWIPVVDIRSTATDAGTCNFSVGCLIGGNFGLGGLSPTADIGANANTEDNAPLIFSDRLNTIASSLAWGIAHEAAHSLSLAHLDASNSTGPNATLLTASEIMKQFGFQQYDGIFGRFDFPLGNNNNNPAVTRNHYERMANDPDIGLRDDNNNGTPDLAYATGTGAHDQVILDDQGNQVDVDVNAFSDSARTSMFTSDSYSIDLTADTEGEILVDAAVNNDEVRVDAAIAAPLRLRGGNGTTGGVVENDLLTLQSGGLDGVYTPGGPGAGTVVYNGGAQIEFSEFENVEADNIPIEIEMLQLVSPSINEGSAAQLSGSFVNIDTQDTHTVVIDWGDGSPTTELVLAPGDRDFDANHVYADDSPSNTSSDTYPITVTITDEDNDEGGAETEIEVNNVAPSISYVGISATSIDESEMVTVSGEFTDPALGVPSEIFTGQAIWSDGVATALTIDGNAGTFTTSRTFLDDHPSTGTPSDMFTVEITIEDDDLGSDDQLSPVLTVNNVDPVITEFESDATFDNKGQEGEPVQFEGAFTDVGVLDTHTAVVDWGDGSPLEMLPLVQGAGDGTFSGAHIYDSGGIYTVTVTVEDDDTGTHEMSTLAVITGVGVNEGVLYVIGDTNDNQVSVNQVGKGQIRVHADFIPEPFRTFSLNDINEMIAYLCEGDDHMTVAGKVTVPSSIHGGGGDDLLKAGGGPTALLGDAGNDRLVGGSASSLLIGGEGKDRLVGGRAADVLIGGSTDLDADDEQLLQLIQDWADPNVDYDARVAAVDAALSVIDDGERDVLTGSSGRDLFFDGLGDALLDVKKNEDTL